MSILFAVLFYFATAVLVLGVGSRIRKYAKTPAPLKIPTTPAPTTRRGVVFRMIKELTIFESLFKSASLISNLIIYISVLIDTEQFDNNL